MDDVDLKNIPQTDRRNYRRLKADNPIAEQAPEDGPEQARREAEKRRAAQSTLGNAANPLSLFFQLFQQLLSSGFGAGPNSASKDWQLDPRGYYGFTSADLANRQVFRTPRASEAVLFAAEVPGGIKDITKEDSYLFVTVDYPDGKPEKYHAYIVSKNDPSKQNEIAITNVDPPSNDRHSFMATLGDGHKVVIGLVSAAIDGNQIKMVETPLEMDRLVKRRVGVGDGAEIRANPPDQSVTGEFDGDKWVFFQKDLKSGRILKFTQSDKDPTLGTLETIQGDPFVPPSSEKEEKQRADDFIYGRRVSQWFSIGESERAPILSSGKLVSMPDKMKEKPLEVPYELSGRSFLALENLIGSDRTPLVAQMRERNRAQIARDNAQQDAVSPQRQPSFPKP